MYIQTITQRCNPRIRFSVLDCSFVSGLTIEMQFSEWSERERRNTFYPAVLRENYQPLSAAHPSSVETTPRQAAPKKAKKTGQGLTLTSVIYVSDHVTATPYRRGDAPGFDGFPQVPSLTTCPCNWLNRPRGCKPPRCVIRPE